MAELGKTLDAGQGRVGFKVGNTKQPLADSPADTVIQKEWHTSDFGVRRQPPGHTPAAGH